jgi:hypothetical protein
MYMDVKGTVADKSHILDIIRLLTDAADPVFRLSVQSRIPLHVYEDHLTSSGQGKAYSARLDGQTYALEKPVLKLPDNLFTAFEGGV